MSNLRTLNVEHLAAMFKALSNPQRLRMFIKLAATCCVREQTEDVGARGARDTGGKARFCCAGDLGADLDLAASTVSHHLKELRQAGLMQVERQGQKISCWVSEETLRHLASFFEGHRAWAGIGGADRVTEGKMRKGRGQ